MWQWVPDCEQAGPKLLSVLSPQVTRTSEVFHFLLATIAMIRDLDCHQCRLLMDTVEAGIAAAN